MVTGCLQCKMQSLCAVAYKRKEIDAAFRFQVPLFRIVYSLINLLFKGLRLVGGISLRYSYRTKMLTICYQRLTM
jgi:hypothetical protein